MQSTINEKKQNKSKSKRFFNSITACINAAQHWNSAQKGKSSITKVRIFYIQIKKLNLKNGKKKSENNKQQVQTSYLPCADWLTSPRWTCSRCFISLSFSNRDIITSFQSCSHQSIVADDCSSNTSSFCTIQQKYLWLSRPGNGSQALQTLFLLGLLLSDFRSPKALSFLGQSSWNFSHRFMTIFCIKLRWWNFDLGPN